MFDLSLAHISNTEHERDLAADLRDRQVLKAAAVENADTAASDTAATAPAPASARDRAPIERPGVHRHATGVRAVLR